MQLIFPLEIYRIESRIQIRINGIQLISTIYLFSSYRLGWVQKRENNHQAEDLCKYKCSNLSRDALLCKPLHFTQNTLSI